MDILRLFQNRLGRCLCHCLCHTLGGLLAGLACSLPAPVQAAPNEYQLKAAFLYHFASFAEWPGEALPASAPFRLCLLGGDPFGAALDELRQKPIKGRRLEVMLIGPEADLAPCHLLYLGSSADRQVERIAALARGTHLLTVGDGEGFAQKGAMLNFYTENGRVRFEASRSAVLRSGLRISSKLLSLARLVDS